MQLTTIDQFHFGQIIYHPLYGEGKVSSTAYGYIITKFKGYAKRKNSHGVISFLPNEEGKFEDLYDEPVYICTRVGAKQIGYVYKPINPEP